MERLRGQRRGAKKIPPDHLYSSTLIRGIVKNQNPKRVCGRPVIIKNRANGEPVSFQCGSAARSGTSPPARGRRLPAGDSAALCSHARSRAHRRRNRLRVRWQDDRRVRAVAYHGGIRQFGVMISSADESGRSVPKDLGLSIARERRRDAPSVLTRAGRTW